MKGYRMPVIIGALALIAIILIESNRPRPIDWSPDYRSGRTIPFGSYIAYDLLPGFFPDQPIHTVDLSLYEALYDGVEEIEPVANYIVATNELRMSELDTRSLLEWVREGGHALIAAREIEGSLADSLFLEFSLLDQEFLANHATNPELTLHFSSDKLGDLQKSAIPIVPGIPQRRMIRQISLFDGERSYVLETLDSPFGEELPVTSLRIELGEGEVIVTTIPETFANVMLLEEKGLQRSSVLLSYLPDAPVYWDDYYKPEGVAAGSGAAAGSPLSYVMRRPPLRTAWILLLGGLLLFVIFAARRRQRVIPVVTPPQNVTLDFVETVGNLYHDQGSFHDIAARRTASLLEYIRGRLDLPTTTIDDLFIRRLSERSGVGIEQARRLAYSISRVEAGGEFGANDLLQYNREIETFYAKTER